MIDVEIHDNGKHLYSVLTGLHIAENNIISFRAPRMGNIYVSPRLYDV